MSPAPIEPGPVVWITGLSGTGKTTIAARLAESLRADGLRPLLLDGDEFRAAVGDGLGHSPDQRLQSARRLLRLTALAAGQGVPVIVATMSLFDEIHRDVRSLLPRVRVVYLHAPIGFLAARDPKGLYADALAGRRAHVVGVDMPFSPPAAPDLSLDVSSQLDLEANVREIRSSLAAWMPITTPC